MSTRDLKPGDRVTVEVTGVVTHVGADEFYVAHGRGGDPMPCWAGHDDAADPAYQGCQRKMFDAWFLHDQPSTVVTVTPRPLPVEPPVGAEVLDSEGRVWRHWQGDPFVETNDWHCFTTPGRTTTWPALLDLASPLRVLGDTIEAP